MRETKSIRLCVSVEIAGRGEAYNKEATESMQKILEFIDGISYIPTVGVFEGIKENSFYVQLDDNHTLLSSYITLDYLIYDIAFKFYEQKAVLLIENDDTCYMVTPDKRKEYIGQWRMKRGTPGENIDCTIFDNNTYGIVL